MEPKPFKEIRTIAVCLVAATPVTGCQKKGDAVSSLVFRSL
jgi:hypothetical protein